MLEVSRSPSKSLDEHPNQTPSYKSGSNEESNEGQGEGGDTVTPLETFEAKTKEGYPQNLNFAQ